MMPFKVSVVTKGSCPLVLELIRVCVCVCVYA